MATHTSLTGATTVGPGTAKHLGKLTAHHTMFVFTNVAPIHCEVRLEGSHDGENWRTLGSVSFSGDTQGGVTTNPNNFIVSDVRANLISIQGPEELAVTATIASLDGV